MWLFGLLGVLWLPECWFCVGNLAGPEGITALAEAIGTGQCQQLQQLNIGSNQAGPEAIAALAEAIGTGQCQQLQMLDIRGNELPSGWSCDALDALKARGVQVFQ